MSRAGYTDDYDGDNWSLIRWRGAVESAIRGKRGQAFLRELIAALDALPAPRLIQEDLVTPDGDYCALGAVGRARGLDLSQIDPYDYDRYPAAFGIANALGREIVYENDERGWRETPERRWARVRAWAWSQLRGGFDDPSEVR